MDLIRYRFISERDIQLQLKVGGLSLLTISL